MDNLRSNLTRIWTHVVSIAWYLRDIKSTWFARMSSPFWNVPFQSLALLNLIVAFMDPYDIQMHVSWYHAIDEKYVHIFVKFECRLSIQVERKTRNKTFSGGMAQPFYCKEWLISQNWDRQPAFKFYKDMDVLFIYGMIPKNMHLDVEWFMNAK
jgi:hypothetical protein